MPFLLPAYKPLYKTVCVESCFYLGDNLLGTRSVIKYRDRRHTREKLLPWIQLRQDQRKGGDLIRQKDLTRFGEPIRSV